MKRLSLILGILVALIFTTAGNSTFAQTESASTKKELKEEQKIQKAKISLIKSKEKLEKLQASHVKKRQTFEKKNSQGKLSPNDVTKHSKALDNVGRQIEKEKKNIEKLEAFIRENESL